MQDKGLGYDLAEMVDAAEDSERLRDLCTEYFEIAIGVRRPTAEEKDTACELFAKQALGMVDLTPTRLVQLSKFPLDFLRRVHYQNEYTIFTMLAATTSIVDGPSLPLFRYAIMTQQELSQENDYDTAIIRQSAFFETYFRMKIGRWKDRHGNHLGWDRCLDCAYRGEDLITEDQIEDLYTVYTCRNDFAHDWRTYIARKSEDTSDVRDAFTTGLSAITTLYHNEFEQTYTDYTDKSLSQRLATTWCDLEKSTLEASEAYVSEFEKECEHCGGQFSVFTEGYKRCPYCDTPHDALSTFSS